MDINCDLGEGVPGEELIFPWIHAASIACGGHCGDRDSMHHSLALAKQFGVKAGAHPSYPDRENFGRKSLEISLDQLSDSLYVQISQLLEIAGEIGMELEHIKFHGALYNDAAKDKSLAIPLAAFLAQNFPHLTVFVPPFSAMEQAAGEYGLNTRLEIFGDRTYQDNYQLLGRGQEKALLTEIEDISAQVDAILNKGFLVSSTGRTLPIQADTLCFHGDNPDILNFLPLIRKQYWTS